MRARAAGELALNSRRPSRDTSNNTMSAGAWKTRRSCPESETAYTLQRLPAWLPVNQISLLSGDQAIPRIVLQPEDTVVARPSRSIILRTPDSSFTIG